MLTATLSTHPTPMDNGQGNTTYYLDEKKITFLGNVPD
jgi:hypothetical protein